jgi:hypothetical protein
MTGWVDFKLQHILIKSQIIVQELDQTSSLVDPQWKKKKTFSRLNLHNPIKSIDSQIYTDDNR